MPYKDKEIGRKHKREYYLKNRENINKKRLVYREKIRERLRKEAKEYREKNRDEINRRARERRTKNRDKFLISERKSYWKHKEKKNKRSRDYSKNNRHTINKNVRKKHNNNPQIRLSHSMSGMIRNAIKENKAGRGWESLVGYTLKDLMKHLEKQFKDRMSWENYGSHWCIDHRIPRSQFKFQLHTTSEFKKCWALNNLQPKKVLENIRKGNKYSEPTLKGWV